MKVLPFMAWRRFAAGFSLMALVIAGGALATKSLNWGLDFTGGTLVEVEYGDTANLQGVRKTLEDSGYEGVVVVAFGTDRDVLIRLPISYSDEQGVAMVEVLRRASSSPVELRRMEFVGPAVGEELREQGGLAMLLALGLGHAVRRFPLSVQICCGGCYGSGARCAVCIGCLFFIGARI